MAAEIRTDRVEMPGLLLDELENEMEQATIGLVPQRPDVDEFNLPSKLMNLMSGGVPVLASVNPHSEVARIVQESGAGWVVDAADPGAFPRRATRHPGRPGGARAAKRRRARVRAAKLQPRGRRDPVRGRPLRGHRGEWPAPGHERLSVAVITGSTGLIGSEAASHFGALGMDVVGIDNDMRRVFFGAEASTAWNRARLEKRARRRPTATTPSTSATATASTRLFAPYGTRDRAGHPRGRAAVARLGRQASRSPTSTSTRSAR